MCCCKLLQLCCIISWNLFLSRANGQSVCHSKAKQIFIWAWLNFQNFYLIRLVFLCCVFCYQIKFGCLSYLQPAPVKLLFLYALILPYIQYCIWMFPLLNVKCETCTIRNFTECACLCLCITLRLLCFSDVVQGFCHLVLWLSVLCLLCFELIYYSVILRTLLASFW